MNILPGVASTQFQVSEEGTVLTDILQEFHYFRSTAEGKNGILPGSLLSCLCVCVVFAFVCLTQDKSWLLSKLFLFSWDQSHLLILKSKWKIWNPLFSMKYLTKINFLFSVRNEIKKMIKESQLFAMQYSSLALFQFRANFFYQNQTKQKQTKTTI